jgi:hypothetical protein
MLVEVKAQAIVDVNLIVPMSDGGRRGRIDYSVRSAQHPVKPGRLDGLGNRVTADHNAVEQDLYFDHRPLLLPFSPTWMSERV